MRIVIGLGSNLGDRHAWLDRAIAAVEASPGWALVARSPRYETEPVGGPEQPRYLNAAIAVEIDDATIEPRTIVAHLLGIERALGRIRNERFGPRTIDLDLLWCDGAVCDDASATVPHPRLHERRFALSPLVDVAHDARDREGRRYAEILAALADDGGVRIVDR